MFKFVRQTGLTVSVEQARHELRESAMDAAVDLCVADSVIDGALRGDACDQESLREFLDITCMESK